MNNSTQSPISPISSLTSLTSNSNIFSGKMVGNPLIRRQLMDLDGLNVHLVIGKEASLAYKNGDVGEEVQRAHCQYKFKNKEDKKLFIDGVMTFCPPGSFSFIRNIKDAALFQFFQINRLERAIINKDDKVVEQLLEMGVNPNSKMQHGLTPIQIAAKNGSFKIAEKLLIYGANIPDAPARSESSLQNERLSIYSAKNTIDALTSMGLSVNKKNDKNSTSHSEKTFSDVLKYLHPSIYDKLNIKKELILESKEDYNKDVADNLIRQKKSGFHAPSPFNQGHLSY